MLYVINSIADPYFSLVNQDPVRSNIPFEQRVGPGRSIYLLKEESSPYAITCLSFQRDIPKSEDQLFVNNQDPTVAVFYTIWSIVPGYASLLINTALTHIKTNNLKIKQFVTLSPKTEMARKFHIRNGARIYQENETSINYEYQ
ncbi:MAG: hypothetical protein RI886_901 [Pseudomonadota bacterium]|jgi:hypothetical protein